jgi:hypothetical protein
MRFKFILFIFHLSFFLFHWAACKEKTTSPPDGNPPDTTSHNFTWRIDTLGTYGSVLYDVAVINENDIWAVGEIHTEDTDRFDSLGNWIQPYNAVHWDGSEWELKRIYTNGSFGSPRYIRLKSIFAFSENDIWITNYVGGYGHWNGSFWKTGWVAGGENKIWGSSSENLFIVGSIGNIIHYDGQTWRKLESGTTINLLDVFGSPDGSVVWACGFDDLTGSVLLKNTGGGFETVARVDDPNGAHLHNIITYVFNTLWTDNSDTVYVGSVGRVYNTPLNYTNFARENLWFDYANSNTYPNTTDAIRGNSPKDIFIAGYQNEIRHFNGISWYNYTQLLSSSGEWLSLSVKENKVVAVGITPDRKALIATGNR